MSTIALSRNITEIQTGIIAKKRKILCKNNRISSKICAFLLRQNLIHFYTLNIENKYEIHVKYMRNLNIIKKISLLSKPSQKIFYSLYKIKTLLWKNKNYIYLISSPSIIGKKYASGFISQNEAVRFQTGGEILVKIELV